MSRHNSSWYLVYFSKWLSGTFVHIYLIEDRQMRWYCQWFEPKHNLNVLLCYMVIHNNKCDIVNRANLIDRNERRRRNQLFRKLEFCYLIIVGICVVGSVILFLFVCFCIYCCLYSSIKYEFYRCVVLFSQIMLWSRLIFWICKSVFSPNSTRYSHCKYDKYLQYYGSMNKNGMVDSDHTRPSKSKYRRSTRWIIYG
jgi:hypothetical protein